MLRHFQIDGKVMVIFTGKYLFNRHITYACSAQFPIKNSLAIIMTKK